MTVHLRGPDAQGRPDTSPGPSVVPWWTVLPMAAAMAYGDGFWMMTVRGAVGAIERTQTPSASWWRESTVVLPLYVLAVLGALTLALRRRRIGQPGRSKVLGTSSVVVAAGTLVGTALIAASTAYDYHLESAQMSMMNSMHGLCIGSCLTQAQHATLVAQVTAVLYGGGLVLVTNLVLVGWLVALAGGRLEPGRQRSRAGGLIGNAGMVDTRRLLLVTGLAGSAAIHAAVVPDHLTEWTGAGVFFIVLTAAEVVIAVALLRTTGRRGVLLAAVAVSIGPVLLWSWSRTSGLPFGPGAGIPEPIGLPDCAAVALELGTLVAALALRGSARRLHHRRPPVSAHVRGLTVAAVIAVSVLGLAGTAPQWFDDSSISSVMSLNH
jgi:hypothetical protein